MNEFCEKHIKDGYGYCEKVNMKVPSMFCRVACKSEWEKYRKEDTKRCRDEMRKPLTDEQKENLDLVTVIIPARKEDFQYLIRTVKSLYENAYGPIEIIVGMDGDETDCLNGCTRTIYYDKFVGQRKIMNDAADIAYGKYLFRVDAHCALSPEWDVRMKSSCGKTDLVAPVFDGLDPKTWEGKGVDMSFCYLDTELRSHYVRPWKRLQDRHTTEETMGISGGAWMIRKDYYHKLGGSEEYLGGHGGVGPEWALKVWLTGGGVLLRTDVVCSHLFRSKVPFPVDQSARDIVFKKLYRKWVLGEDKRRTRPIEWLLYKFNDYVKGRPTIKTRKPENAAVQL